MKLPRFLKKYFWDVEFPRLDSKKDSSYITARILEYGDVKAIRWLFRALPKGKIKEVVRKSRQFSPKSINFWSLFFNIKPNQIECLRRSYQKTQKSHWPH